MIQVFKIVAPDGDIDAANAAFAGNLRQNVDYWATNDLKISELQRLQWAEFEWSIQLISSRLEAVLRG